jgi:hypothetical protein
LLSLFVSVSLPDRRAACLRNQLASQGRVRCCNQLANDPKATNLSRRDVPRSAFASRVVLGFHFAVLRYGSAHLRKNFRFYEVRLTFVWRIFQHFAFASCLLRTRVRSVTGWMRYPARCLSQPARLRVLTAPCCLAPAQPYATPTNRIRALNNGLRRCPTPISAFAAAALRPACDPLRNRCFSVLGLRFVRRPITCNHAIATAALPAAPGELLSQIRLLLASLGAFALVVDRLPPLSLAFAYESC